METAELQRVVREFTEKAGIEAALPSRLLDLTSEVGELAKELLCGTAYGKQEFKPTAGWSDELGDVAFVLFVLAAQSGVDLETATQRSMAKYKMRLGRSGTADSG